MTVVDYLDPGVAPISDQDIVLRVDGDPCRCVELTVALTVRAEAEQEDALRVKDLKRERQSDDMHKGC